MLGRKIVSILLIPTLLWAGAGFLLSQHYCLDQLVSEHLYHQENSCGMDLLMGSSDCHDDHEEEGLNPSDCCKDVWIQIDNIDTVSFDLKGQTIAQEFQVIIEFDEPAPFRPAIAPKDIPLNRPPPEGRVIKPLSERLSLLQSFLI